MVHLGYSVLAWTYWYPMPAVATMYLCGPYYVTWSTLAASDMYRPMHTIWYALTTIDMCGATYIDYFIYISLSCINTDYFVLSYRVWK